MSHDDLHVLDDFRTYRETRDRTLRDRLVLQHGWIAQRCARRFTDRGEPLADLIQVAQIGVVKAVERFDPENGASFPSFAVPTVMGELRRHFRDATWSVSVPRRSKDLIGRLNSTVESLSHQLERSPRVDEIAEAMGVTEEVVIETMEANSVYRTSSLDEPFGPEAGSRSSQDRMGRADPDLYTADLRLSTLAAMDTLDERTRCILVWRFYEGCTQREIGERLGIGQVQVSRLLRAALAELRSPLGEA